MPTNAPADFAAKITVSMDQLITAFAKLGDVGAQMGVSFEEAANAFGSLGNTINTKDAEQQAAADFELLVTNGVDPKVAADAIQKIGPMFSPSTHVQKIKMVECVEPASEIEVVQATKRHVEIPD